ncbi:cysteine hydrolase [Eubacteriales bacterium OttesenSCG-928-M02]|nr:cysteine hydrolase [Eubacteriales bacterium OttesenSCG-928-M02]
MSHILVVVDYQVDFVTGALGFPGADALLDGIQKKVDAQMATDGLTIFTMDTHDESYPSTREGAHLPIPHCIRNTDGWNLFGSLHQYQGVASSQIHTVQKPTFGATTLPDSIKNRVGTPESIELCGLVTNMCVIANAILLSAAFPNTKIIVDAALCGSGDKALHEKALDVMAALHMDVINR